MVPSLVPSMFPSSEPSISSSTAPSESPSSNPSNSCHDVASFRNRIGRGCADFLKSTPCERYVSLGFSHTEVYELLANCPHTCGICEPVIRPSLLLFISDNRPSDGTLVSNKMRLVRPPTARPTVRLTSRPTGISTLHPTGGPDDAGADDAAASPPEGGGRTDNNFSFTGMDGRCEDSRKFKTHMGLTCRDHKNLNCLDIQSIGFTPKQMLQLLSNCPKTCDVCL